MPMTRNTTGWLAVRRELTTRGKWTLGVASFLLPFAVWCLISYVPFIWHPQMRITNPGSVDYFQTGMQIDRDVFDDELAHARATHAAVPEGVRANPSARAAHAARVLHGVHDPAGIPRRRLAAREPGTASGSSSGAS